MTKLQRGGWVLLLSTFILPQAVLAIDSSVVADPKKTEAKSDVDDVPTIYDRSQYWDELSLRLTGMTGFDGYRQQPASGATTSTNPSLNYGGGMEVRFRPVSTWYSFYGKGRHQRTPYTYQGALPRGLQPRDFTIIRNQYAVGVILNPFGQFGSGRTEWENVGLEIGYGYRYRDAPKNIPVTIISSVKEMGMILAVHYDRPLFKNLSIETKAELFLPNAREEQGEFTGFGLNAWTSVAEALVLYRFSDIFEAGAGINLTYGSAIFTEQGNRGDSRMRPRDSKEKEYGYGVPITARVFF